MSKVNKSVMDKNSKSHGKKSDKETHTPMLKIFKDMMQLEMNNPEKTNLLNEKERHRKKKQYSTSRPEHILNRSDTSISDVNEMDHAQPIMENRHYDVHPCKASCDDPRCNESLKGWRMKSLIPRKLKYRRISEDTSSHRSCALKRVATSEYACLICLGVVFAITILVAFFMVFKTPICTHISKKPSLKSKFKNFRGFTFESQLKDNDFDRNDWDDSQLGRINDIPVIPSSESDDSNSRGLNLGGTNNQFTDLSRIIDINKLNYGKSSERLKSFYKKLLQTDDQINNLKKGCLDSSMNNFKNSERRKRSLKHHQIRSIDDLNTYEVENRSCIEKFVDHLNSSWKPMSASVFLEQKQLMLNYPNNEKKIVPKCSHVPKESKSHEIDLKHPFYKHTQRLDELLDKMLDKNLEKMMFDPFSVGILGDDLTTTENIRITTPKSPVIFKTKTHKTTTPYGTIVHKTTTTQLTPLKPTIHKTTSRKKGVSSKYEPIIINSYPEDFFKISPTNSKDLSVMLGVTAIMSSPKHSLEKSFKERFPARKLMQYEEEEGLGYEDLKEVLNDDVDPPEDPEVKADRSKRDMTKDLKPVFELGKSSTASVPIPNWKGPLPLYPDELNTMIKQEVKNPAKAPRTPDAPLISDIEYIEDYLAHKYDKLAQAYSDYGVLEEKKPQKNEKSKDGTVNEHRGRSTPVDHHAQIKKPTTQKGFSTFSDDDWDVTDNPSEEIKDINVLSNKKTYNNGLFGSVVSVESTSNENENDGVSQAFGRLKALNTLPKLFAKDFLSINVGSEDDSKNDDALLTIGYGFDKNKNEFRLKTPEPNNALAVIKKLFSNDSFKSRSLKSVMGDTDEGVIERNDNITSRNYMIPLYNLTSHSKKGTSENPKDYKNRPVSLVTVNTTLDNVTNNTYAEKVANEFGIHITNPLDNVTNITNEEKTVNESETNISSKLTKKSILELVNSVNARNNTSKEGSGMDLSDLFRLFSSWFSSLASASLDSDDQSESNSSIMVIKTNEAPNAVKDDAKNISDIVYPTYDTDMVDNIGHRSRVLMAVEEVSNATEDNKDKETDSEKSNKDLNVTNTTEPKNAIQTTQEYERDTNTPERDEKENKTVVKRSLTDSGLVFWSDIYDDDEYGVKDDQMDENNRKSQHKGRDFMRRSKNWIQDKVKSLAENIKDLHGDGMQRSALGDRNPKVFKRQVTPNTGEATEKVPSFAELKVKMRSICKEAARAVQQTRKMHARESPEDTASSSIMQQLVRMMSDLVDYQVKQRTCIKLPEDLQNFLEWLTVPNQDQSRRQTSQELGFMDDIGKDKEFEQSSPLDEKAEYLNSLRSVEDLIHLYGQMNDEEKSKMSGVKEYLNNQQDFLTKQIAILDELHLSDMYDNQNQIRIRRQLDTDITPKLKKKRRRKLKKRPGKIMKSTVYKKKSTVISYDDVVENAKIEALNNDHNNINENHDTHRCNDDFNFIFETNSKNPKNSHPDNIAEFDVVSNKNKYSLNNDFNRIDDSKIDKEFGDVVTKRNLQDVYYRAVNEAKKLTTGKPGNKY